MPPFLFHYNPDDSHLEIAILKISIAKEKVFPNIWKLLKIIDNHF